VTGFWQSGQGAVTPANFSATVKLFPQPGQITAIDGGRFVGKCIELSLLPSLYFRNSGCKPDK
jgi:hypothetical protein